MKKHEFLKLVEQELEKAIKKYALNEASNSTIGRKAVEITNILDNHYSLFQWCSLRTDKETTLNGRGENFIQDCHYNSYIIENILNTDTPDFIQFIFTVKDNVDSIANTYNQVKEYADQYNYEIILGANKRFDSIDFIIPMPINDLLNASKFIDIMDDYLENNDDI